MSVFFTADLHCSHGNIIKHSRRPFANITEMDDTLIHNINALIQKNDTFYILGDLSWNEQATHKFLGRVNCNNIHYIRGNHEGGTKTLEYQFKSCENYAEIIIESQRIVLCHYPLLSWRGMYRESWMLHGHCHGNLKDDPYARRIDVGVDCFNYFPVSFDQIKEIMSKKKFKYVDHHKDKNVEESS